MTYDPATSSLIFQPSEADDGRVFYFTIGLSDPTGEQIYFQQQCRVNVGGKSSLSDGTEADSQPERPELDKVRVDFSIKSLDQEDDKISVQIKFSQAINMAYIRDTGALGDMFEVTWYPTSGLQTVQANGTISEKYQLEPILVVAEFNRIFFDVDL